MICMVDAGVFYYKHCITIHKLTCNLHRQPSFLWSTGSCMNHDWLIRCEMTAAIGDSGSIK